MTFSKFSFGKRSQSELLDEASLSEHIHYLKYSMVDFEINNPESTVRLALEAVIARNEKDPVKIQAARDMMKIDKYLDKKVREYLPSWYFPPKKKRAPYIPD